MPNPLKSKSQREFEARLAEWANEHSLVEALNGFSAVYAKRAAQANGKRESADRK